jgi:hypothetical protein
MPASKSSTKKKPVKTSKQSSSKRPRASSASEADIPKKKPRRKPANDTSEDEATSSSPERPHRKGKNPKTTRSVKAKPKARRPLAAVPVVEEVVEEDVQMVSEPEVVVDESDKNSVGFKLNAKEGTYFSKVLSDRHVAEVQARLTIKAETSRDLDLIFTKRVQVVFTTPNGKSETRDGRWCILCK